MVRNPYEWRATIFSTFLWLVVSWQLIRRQSSLSNAALLPYIFVYFTLVGRLSFQDQMWEWPMHFKLAVTSSIGAGLPHILPTEGICPNLILLRRFDLLLVSKHLLHFSPSFIQLDIWPGFADHIGPRFPLTTNDHPILSAITASLLHKGIDNNAPPCHLACPNFTWNNYLRVIHSESFHCMIPIELHVICGKWRWEQLR